MISLGQSNTIISCPALTTHSELPADGIERTGHYGRRRSALPSATKTRATCSRIWSETAQITIDPVVPGFSSQFPRPAETDFLVRDCYLEVHRRYIESKCSG